MTLDIESQRNSKLAHKITFNAGDSTHRKVRSVQDSKIRFYLIYHFVLMYNFLIH